MHVGRSQQQQGKHLGCASSSEIISVVLYKESHGTKAGFSSSQVSTSAEISQSICMEEGGHEGTNAWRGKILEGPGTV